MSHHNVPNLVGIVLGHREGCRSAGMDGGAIVMGGKGRDGEGARRGREGNEGCHKWSHHGLMMPF